MTSLLFSILSLPIHAASLHFTIDIGAATEGDVYVKVFDSAQTFKKMEGDIAHKTFTIRPSANYIIQNIPSGSIAVIAFYDVNKNGKLDKNFMGIPKEPVALSNNYTPKGPPSFKKALLHLKKGDRKTITLSFRPVSIP
jgi:MipA family protein